MIHYKFSNELDKQFTATIQKRSREYFKSTSLSRNANPEMIFKSIFAISLFLVPYGLMITGVVTNVPIMFLLWVVMGGAMAFIGTSVMHDALHGSYSNKKHVNLIMGFSAAMLGVDAKIWKLQHNVLHHTYTNIEDADEDIQPRFLFRFSPHQPRRWFHRYQHIYAIVIYGISTFLWVTLKDFAKLIQYRNKDLIAKGREFNLHLAGMIVRKILYWTALIALPMILFPVSALTAFLMFLTMHIVAGVSLSLVFQPAHVVPSSSFIRQEEEQIQENWFVHQLYTTSNFGMNNKFLSWFIGGLNFQIEHHLFPNICHVHYPKLASIIQETTKEFDLPYYSERSFTAAIKSHFGMLRSLGRGEVSEYAMAH